MGIFHCPLYASLPEDNCFGMNLTPPGQAQFWVQPSKWEGHVKPRGTKRGFPWSGNLLWNILKEHSAWEHWIEDSSFNTFNDDVEKELRLISWSGSFIPLFTGFHTSQVIGLGISFVINSRTVVKLGMVGWKNHQVVAMLVLHKGSFSTSVTPAFLTQLPKVYPDVSVSTTKTLVKLRMIKKSNQKKVYFVYVKYLIRSHSAIYSATSPPRSLGPKDSA